MMPCRASLHEAEKWGLGGHFVLLQRLSWRPKPGNRLDFLFIP